MHLMIETVKEQLYKFTTFKNTNIIEMWSGYLFIFIFEDLFIYLFIYSDYQERWLENPIVLAYWRWTVSTPSAKKSTEMYFWGISRA